MCSSKNTPIALRVEQRREKHGGRRTANGVRSVFPQNASTARFSPFFSPAEPANSSGMAAKTLRKMQNANPVEICAEKLMKNAGKPAELLGFACAKDCG